MEKQQAQAPPPTFNVKQPPVDYSGPPPVHAQPPPAPPPSSSEYPGVAGATPREQQGVEGYDAYGQPIRPPFMNARYDAERSLGPSCSAAGGGYHELRMHYTNTSLCFAILIFPYLCGWRGKRKVMFITKKMHQNVQRKI